MRYFVIATKWDDTAGCQINYIAGEFAEYINARLFRDAYNKHYSTEAQIFESNCLQLRDFRRNKAKCGK